MISNEDFLKLLDKYDEQIVKKNDFNPLYLHLQSYDYPWNVGFVTDTFYEAGFDPLKGMKEVTVCMFFDSKQDKVTIPDNINAILDYAFTDSKITKLIIPSSVKDISEDAFTNSSINEVIFLGTKDEWIELGARLPKGAKVKTK